MSNNSTAGKRKMKANWNEKNIELFIDLCITEVKAGNRTTSHFNNIGWTNIIEKFSVAVGRPYVYKQLKNRWDLITKDYVLWLRLIGKETGLGWDPKKKTIAASDEWWDKKLQEVPKVSKFRDRGLDNLPKLEFLFKSIRATGEGAWAPSSGQLPRGVVGTSQGPRLVDSEDMIEESVDSTDGPDQTNLTHTPTPTPTPTPKPPTQDKGKKRCSARLAEGKGKKPMGAAAVLSCQIERICEAMESRITATSRLLESLQPRNTIEECIQLLDTIPEIECGSDMYLVALESFVTKDYRDIFMAINGNDVRVAWLQKLCVRGF